MTSQAAALSTVLGDDDEYTEVEYETEEEDKDEQERVESCAVTGSTSTDKVAPVTVAVTSSQTLSVVESLPPLSKAKRQRKAHKKGRKSRRHRQEIGQHRENLTSNIGANANCQSFVGAATTITDKLIHVRSKDPRKIAKRLERALNGDNGGTGGAYRSGSGARLKRGEKFEPVEMKIDRVCPICDKEPYLVEKIVAEKRWWHKDCFRCATCAKLLNHDTYLSHEGVLYCRQHHRELFQPKVVVNNVVSVASSDLTQAALALHEEQQRRRTIQTSRGDVDGDDGAEDDGDEGNVSSSSEAIIAAMTTATNSASAVIGPSATARDYDSSTRPSSTSSRGGCGGTASDRYGIMDKLRRLDAGEDIEELLAEIDAEMPTQRIIPEIDSSAIKGGGRGGCGRWATVATKQRRVRIHSEVDEATVGQGDVTGKNGPDDDHEYEYGYNDVSCDGVDDEANTEQQQQWANSSGNDEEVYADEDDNRSEQQMSRRSEATVAYLTADAERQRVKRDRGLQQKVSNRRKRDIMMAGRHESALDQHDDSKQTMVTLEIWQIDLLNASANRIKRTVIDVRSENAKRFTQLFEQGQVPEAAGKGSGSGQGAADKMTLEKEMELEQMRRARQQHRDFFNQLEMRGLFSGMGSPLSADNAGTADAQQQHSLTTQSRAARVRKFNVPPPDNAEDGGGAADSGDEGAKSPNNDGSGPATCELDSLSKRFSFFENYSKKSSLKGAACDASSTPTRGDSTASSRRNNHDDPSRKDCKASVLLSKFKDWEMRAMRGENIHGIDDGDDVRDGGERIVERSRLVRDQHKIFVTSSATPDSSDDDDDDDNSYSTTTDSYDTDVSSDYTDDDELNDSKPIDVDLTLKAMKDAARSKLLRAKFEEWEKSGDCHEQVRQVEAVDENGRSLETASYLRTKFEALRLLNPTAVSSAAPSKSGVTGGGDPKNGQRQRRFN